ncbi:MAG: type II toxin-antitoxin system VapB family antitoxin [Bifidobacteriaceae bacterium]|jgi:Arc/MetJ family transcription regulator|nr:type II toxin-antitoxin system VapB family antitoxin [Bifidobacteriaceae bacterium]
MRTNIDIEEQVMAEAIELSGLRTKRAVVDQALREFVARRRRLDLRDLAGKVRFSEGYDYKELREGQR